jgi:hypothetical protein
MGSVGLIDPSCMGLVLVAELLQSFEDGRKWAASLVGHAGGVKRKTRGTTAGSSSLTGG